MRVWVPLLSIMLTLGAALGAWPTLEQVFEPFHEAFPSGGDRLAAKKAAFDAAVARQGVAALPRAMRGCEGALAEIDDLIRKDAEAYEKSGLAYYGWRAAYTKDFEKRHGRPPSEWNVPPAINDDFIRKEDAFKKSLSFKRRERSFHAWVEVRAVELLLAADDAARTKAVGAFASGLKEKRAEQRLRCAAVLGALVDPQAAAALEKAFSAERDGTVAAALLDARCRAGPGDALPLLRDALSHAAWQVRAAAAAALKARPSREAVDLLVARLPAETGRLLDDIGDALRALTGQQIGGDAAGWKGYWEGAREGWTPPPSPPKTDPEEERLRPPAVHSDGAASFLSIPTRSEAVILCLDGSVENIWEALRLAAEAFVQALPDRASLNIVLYGQRPLLFRKKMAVGVRGTAVEWLAKWKPEPGADPCGALEAALDLAGGGRADTIYFLTIAPATHGLITDTSHIGQEIVALNRTAGVRVHAIGVSEGRDAYWLQEIARQFGGTYSSPR